jgi:hypothetical protein
MTSQKSFVSLCSFCHGHHANSMLMVLSTGCARAGHKTYEQNTYKGSMSAPFPVPR